MQALRTPALSGARCIAERRHAGYGDGIALPGVTDIEGAVLLRYCYLDPEELSSLSGTVFSFRRLIRLFRVTDSRRDLRRTPAN